MSYDIEKKLVIAVASSALFDLKDSDKIFREKGEDEYRLYQQKNIHLPLQPGVAFPFIKRLLKLNSALNHEEHLVEVILLSKNDPDTGLRVFESIAHHKLDITRAAFLAGSSPYRYLKAYNACLFLSANSDDVNAAIAEGFPAGLVLPTEFEDDGEDELRISFDFDGVLADDAAEKVFHQHGLEEFTCHEQGLADVPHNPGLLFDLFRRIAFFQKLERAKAIENPNYHQLLRVSIVTARSAPAHKRVVTTLNQWGISPDETFFLGGWSKLAILDILKPHMFFDDQLSHLKSSAKSIPCVHIPFGIANNKK